ncbi:hypothetical protein ACFWP0_19460 [Achromobacter sp. NPDC058515]|uniref:hypothetical protein n=1 Tax=Achromobacter sp. NPDC058515 TaxID=3346533 RepID=UPI003669A1D9
MTMALACLGAVAATEETDLQALRFASEQAAPETVQERPVKYVSVQLEAAVELSKSMPDSRRASLDTYWDRQIDGNWRAVLSNRIDARISQGAKGDHAVNLLKEAYLTRNFDGHAMLDAGRINARYGVARGYNPTDFLGVGAHRSIVSGDPDMLQKNRLGNAMIRWQRLWDEASVTLLWSPKLADKPDARGSSLDWGASNSKERLLFSGNYRLSEDLNPQLVVYREQGGEPQIGVNASRVLGESTVAYFEWAGGKTGRKLRAQPDADEKWRNRLSTGATWTSDSKLNLTFEVQRDETATTYQRPKHPFLSAYPTGVQYQLGDNLDPLALLRGRASVLLRADWQDSIVDNLNLSILRAQNTDDDRAMGWAEARYHHGVLDYALQWQRIYGELSPQAHVPRQTWQFIVSYFY